MTDEKKQELFPYFAYLYSQKLNPDKYGNGKSIDEWTSLIKESPEDIDTITKAASQLSDEDWNSLEQQYESQQEGGAQFAKKGAKLKKLQGMKKGGKAKKCSCGCDLITIKEDGGKLTTKCSCNCGGGKLKKHQEGGSIQKFGNGAKTIDPSVFYGGEILDNIGNTLSDIVRYNDKDYKFKTQYWDNKHKQSMDRMNQSKTTSQSSSNKQTIANPPITQNNKTQTQTRTANPDVSVYDYLTSQGKDASYNARKNMASEFGIENYHGSADQNKLLITKLKEKAAQSTGTASTTTPPVQTGTTETTTGTSATNPGTGATTTSTTENTPSTSTQLGTPGFKLWNPYDNSEIMQTILGQEGWRNRYNPTFDNVNGILNSSTLFNNSMYGQQSYLPPIQFKKGGKVKSKQSGGDVVSSQSQVGVAKNGVKLGIKELKKEELKNAEVADPKVTPMQKSLKNKKDITKVMDKETLKRLKSKTKK